MTPTGGLRRPYASRPSLVNNCADKALNEINVVRPSPLTRNKQTGVYIKKKSLGEGH